MLTTILCPSCGKSIEVTQALELQIGKHVAEDLAEKHKKELEIERTRIEIEMKKKLEEKNTLELSDLKKQLEEKDAKVTQMRNEELKLREEKRRLEEKEKDLTLEVTRQVDQERKRIEELVTKQTTEAFRMKELEYEKKLKDLSTSLSEANRKANQGSQQLQGEVQELDLETILRQYFPNDTIEPVGKGIRGADVTHIVKSPRGFICGIILWESKRTKSWSDEWTVKLKDDLRAAKANIPVIVSTALPPGATSDIYLKDGVWVTTHALVIALAELLRKNLLDVAYQKALMAHQGEKADLLFDYVTGHEFRQQVEAVLEVYKEMKEQLDRERIAFEKSWKAREGQLNRIVRSMANIYGSMQGVIGGSLPQVKGLELIEGGNEESDELKLL